MRRVAVVRNGKSQRIALVFTLAATITTATLEAQGVTVTTKKGETIQGVLKSASESEVTLEVGGQTLRLPISTLRLISFEPSTAASSPTTAASSPMAEAFKALDELNQFTEIGMLRDQYAAKLLESLSRVQPFIASKEGSWADVRLVLRAAVTAYQRPLSNVGWWDTAPGSWKLAAQRVAGAKTLAAQPGEESHRESPAELQATLKSTVKGRLGMGDQLRPEKLSRVGAGGFNDVYRFDIAAATTLVLTLTTDFTGGSMVLVDGMGKEIAEENEYANFGTGQLPVTTRLSKSVKPGVYRLWVGSPGIFNTSLDFPEATTYTLQIDSR